MYANLLAASMQADKKWTVHPSFVDIIKQLTPDEAKILKAIPPSIYSYIPVLDVRIKHPGKTGFQVVYSNYSNIAEGICECPQNISAYLENLDRLKLIELDKMQYLTDTKLYEALEQSETIQNIINRSLGEGDTSEFQHGCFRLTSFGLSFVKTCILGD